mmetsp:Transcript_5683/g.10773  ORF Transcript_5683/g.10773 Transcript_5683/m.10773 type:complete len:396 (-) Transcript_5683:2277-3464(-)
MVNLLSSAKQANYYDNLYSLQVSSKSCIDQYINVRSIYGDISTLPDYKMQKICTSEMFRPNEEQGSSCDFVNQFKSVEDECVTNGGKVIYFHNFYVDTFDPKSDDPSTLMFDFSWNIRQCIGISCSSDDASLLLNEEYNPAGNNLLFFGISSYDPISNDHAYAGDPSVLSISKKCINDFNVIKQNPGSFPYLSGDQIGDDCHLDPSSKSVTCDLTNSFLSVEKECQETNESENSGTRVQFLDFYRNRNCDYTNGLEVKYTNVRQCVPKTCTHQDAKKIFNAKFRFDDFQNDGCKMSAASSAGTTTNDMPLSSSSRTSSSTSYTKTNVIVSVSVVLAGILAFTMILRKAYSRTRHYNGSNRLNTSDEQVIGMVAMKNGVAVALPVDELISMNGELI